MKKRFFRFRKQFGSDGSGHGLSRRQLAAPAVLTAFLASAMIAGCGQKQEDDYIGLNAATEAAFRDAGVTAAEASVSTAPTSILRKEVLPLPSPPTTAVISPSEKTASTAPNSLAP